MPTSVKLSELLDAYEWVSGLGPFENSAYLDRTTGKIYIDSDQIEVDEDLPEDYEDGTKYVSIPHKNDLDLGKNLAIQFADDFLWQESVKVREFFRKRGAYARFKNLLEHRRMLEQWYIYEAEAIESALREWAQDNDIQIQPDIQKTPG